MTELGDCAEQQKQMAFFAIRFSKQLQQNNKSPNQRLKEDWQRSPETGQRAWLRIAYPGKRNYDDETPKIHTRV